MSQTGPRDTPHTSRLAVQGGLGELLLTKMLGLYDGFGFATSCQHRAQQGGALRASRPRPGPKGALRAATSAAIRRLVALMVLILSG